MIAIKIQCGCGQKYSFETEPVNDRMGYAINCPICGADGTAAANQAIAQSLHAQPAMAGAAGVPFQSAPPALAAAVAPAPAPASRIAASAPVATPPALPTTPGPGGRSAPSKLLPGQVDRTQAETEARAKIFWGDEPQEVVKFLMIQGLTVAEASAKAEEFFAERAVTIRRNGFKKIGYGTLMACLPIGFWFAFSGSVLFPMKIFAFTIMIGLYGAYQAVKGTIMVIAPRSEPGDVSDQ